MAIVTLNQFNTNQTMSGDDVHTSHIDIVVPNRYDIREKERLCIPMQFNIELNPDEYGIIQPIHSLASKYELLLLSTVIHPGFVGTPNLELFNLSNKLLELKAGEHVAQLIIVKAGTVTLSSKTN